MEQINFPSGLRLPSFLLKKIEEEITRNDAVRDGNKNNGDQGEGVHHNNIIVHAHPHQNNYRLAEAEEEQEQEHEEAIYLSSQQSQATRRSSSSCAPSFSSSSSTAYTVIEKNELKPISSYTSEHQNRIFTIEEIQKKIWRTSVALVDLQKQIYKGEEAYYEETLPRGNIFRGWRDAFIDTNIAGSISSGNNAASQGSAGAGASGAGGHHHMGHHGDVDGNSTGSGTGRHHHGSSRRVPSDCRWFSGSCKSISRNAKPQPFTSTCSSNIMTTNMLLSPSLSPRNSKNKVQYNSKVSLSSLATTSSTHHTNSTTSSPNNSASPTTTVVNPSSTMPAVAIPKKASSSKSTEKATIALTKTNNTTISNTTTKNIATSNYGDEKDQFNKNDKTISNRNTDEKTNIRKQKDEKFLRKKASSSSNYNSTNRFDGTAISPASSPPLSPRTSNKSSNKKSNLESKNRSSENDNYKKSKNMESTKNENKKRIRKATSTDGKFVAQHESSTTVAKKMKIEKTDRTTSTGQPIVGTLGAIEDLSSRPIPKNNKRGHSKKESNDGKKKKQGSR